MSGFFVWYIAAWGTACVLALAVFLWKRESFALARRDYWRFLLQPWKVALFLPAAGGMMIMAPWTGDPTWDWIDAGFMSVLTFATAPWVLGVIYGALRRRAGWEQVYVAVCLWMFSASWSYDLYILLRDGAYPLTWSANIFASSVLYISAGLLWNLDYRVGRGVIFAFMEDGWPAPPQGPVFGRLVWYALPFVILAAAMLLPFLLT